jgi:hypothetical protein
MALFMMVGCTHSCTATSASNVAANTYNDIEGVVNLSCQRASLTLMTCDARRNAQFCQPCRNSRSR